MENSFIPEMSGGVSDTVNSEGFFAENAETAVDTAERSPVGAADRYPAGAADRYPAGAADRYPAGAADSVTAAEDNPTEKLSDVDEISDVKSAEGSSAVTQEQLNSIVARESGRAVEKALRELGFNGTGKGREQLKQFRVQLDERAAEFAAQTEKLAQAEAAFAEKDNEIAQLRASLDEERTARMLTASGVGDGALEKALSLVKGLASGGEDLSTAVAEIVEKYPHLVNGKRVVPRFSAPTGGNDGFSAMKAIFRRK